MLAVGPTNPTPYQIDLNSTRPNSPATLFGFVPKSSIKIFWIKFPLLELPAENFSDANFKFTPDLPSLGSKRHLLVKFDLLC